MTGTAVTFSNLDWAVVALYFVANTAICIWCALTEGKGHGGLLPREPQRRLVPDRLIHLRVEHRRRAPHRSRRFRRRIRHGVRALGAALVPGPGPRLGVRAVLPARAHLHDTGIPRAPLHAGHPHLPFRHLPVCLRAHQGIGDHLCRRVRDPDDTRLSDDRTAIVRRHGFLLVLRAVPRDHHRRFRGARRHEVRPVDRSDARAGAARGFRRGAVRRSRPDRRTGCHGRRERGGESRQHPPVARPVDDARDAGLPGLPVRSEHHAVARRVAVLADHRSAGTGARTSTSCSACSPRAGSRRRAAAPSSPPISSSPRYSSSCSPA